MKKALLAIALLLLPGMALGQGGTPAGGYNVGSGSGSGSSGTAINSDSPPSGAAIPFAGKACFAPNVTTTNTSTTVSCSTATFTSANVGNTIFASTWVPTSDSNYTVATLSLNSGIVSITNTTTVVVSNPAIATSDSTHGALIWGPLEDSQWDNIETLATAGLQCLGVQLGSGYSLVSRRHFAVTPSTCNNAQTGSPRGMQIIGKGKFSTTIIPIPGFTWTGLSNNSGYLFSNIAGLTVENLAIWGGGNSNTSNPATSQLMHLGTDAQAINIQLTGLSAADTGFGACLELDNNYAFNVIIDGCGGNSALILSNAFFLDGFVGNQKGTALNIPAGVAGVTRHSQFQNLPTINTPAVLLGSGAGWETYRDNVVCNASISTIGVQSSGASIIRADHLSVSCPAASNGGMQILGTTNLNLQNSSIVGGSATWAISSVAGATLRDLGDNTYTGPFSIASGSYFPYKGVNGTCTGVVPASQTIGFYGTGFNVTTLACATTVGTGIVMDHAGSVGVLQTSATAAGVNASSGVVSVLKNGSATGMPTCTIGTGTSCVGQPAGTFAIGDRISIQVTSQAADTLAGVSAQVATN